MIKRARSAAEDAAVEEEPQINEHDGSLHQAGAVTVSASDERTALEPLVDTERWGEVVLQTLLGEDVSSGNVDVFFVDEDMMADLNRTHMRADGPTDVLSFPLDDNDALGLDLPGLTHHLGDIVLCPSVAHSQAPDHAGDYESELTLLLVHGVLHLLGHDHTEPDETIAMRGREAVHLERYGIAHPTP